MSMDDVGGTTTETDTRPEPQPWQSPEDAKGWRVVGVGKRHPRWLEFEIAAIAHRHDPLGIGDRRTQGDEYRRQGREIVAQLRAMNPGAASADDIRRLVRAAFAKSSGTTLTCDESAFDHMTEEIIAASRQHASVRK